MPNRQARADRKLVSIGGTSLYHEARAAGVIYQATLRRELHRSLGLEWAPIDESTGMAELAGVESESITAQKATRLAKPEQLAWAQLAQMWREDVRGVRLDRGYRWQWLYDQLRGRHRRPAPAPARRLPDPRRHREPRRSNARRAATPRAGFFVLITLEQLMLRTMLKSKIHRATVTQANLHYVGSLTIDADLMDAADLLEGEQVTIVDIENGNRLVTYAITGERGSRVIGINGAAAHLVHPGDLVILIAYSMMDDAEARSYQPKIVFVDADNNQVDLGADPAYVPGDFGLLSPR